MKSAHAILAAPCVAFILFATAYAQTGPKSRGDPSTWITTDDYPPLAASERREGRVTARISIDATGRVSDCGVISSSSHADLDNQTCFLILRRARFTPAQDANGNAVPSIIARSIRWKLPDPEPTPAYDAPAYAAPAYSAPAPHNGPTDFTPAPPPASFSSKQMTEDMQRQAAELLARKQKPK